MILLVESSSLFRCVQMIVKKALYDVIFSVVHLPSVPLDGFVRSFDKMNVSRNHKASLLIKWMFQEITASGSKCWIKKEYFLEIFFLVHFVKWQGLSKVVWNAQLRYNSHHMNCYNHVSCFQNSTKATVSLLFC